MVTIALTHVLQQGPLLQHLVSSGAPFCVDQWQSDWLESDFLHQSQLLMSVHFEKKSAQGVHATVHVCDIWRFDSPDINDRHLLV